MKRNTVAITMNIVCVISLVMLVAACAYTSGTESAQEITIYESAEYEANMDAASFDKESLAQAELEKRLEKSITEMTAIASVSVRIHKGGVGIDIRTDEHHELSDEQKANIIDLVKRSASGISEHDINLDIRT